MHGSGRRHLRAIHGCKHWWHDRQHCSKQHDPSSTAVSFLLTDLFIPWRRHSTPFVVYLFHRYFLLLVLWWCSFNAYVANGFPFLCFFLRCVQSVHKLLKARNDAYAVKLQNPTSVSHALRWKALRSQVQKELRQMENSWWVSKAREIQSYADTNDTQKFYEAIKATYGSSHHSVHPVRFTLIKDQQGILTRWAEHLGDLLNHLSALPIPHL